MSSAICEGCLLRLLDGLTGLVAIDRAPLTRVPAVVAPVVLALVFEQQQSALTNSRRKLSLSQPYSSGLQQAEPRTSRWQIGYAMPPTYAKNKSSN